MVTSPLTPATPAKRRMMQAQQERDTAPERALRRALHAKGLRYRLHVPIVPGTRRRVDIAFGPSRVAVDVRGCFWHGCPTHGTQPKANAAWWQEKLARNVARDEDTVQRLAAAGWELVVVWEHDDPEVAAARVAAVVAARRPRRLSAFEDGVPTEANAGAGEHEEDRGERDDPDVPRQGGKRRV